MSDVHILAIDLAKRSFQVCATDRGGAVHLALLCDKAKRNFASFVALPVGFILLKSVHTAQPLTLLLVSQASQSGRVCRP